jgi:hypothetical protein
MASILCQGQTYHSTETVVYRHGEKWVLADLTINPDGTIGITGLLDNLDLVFRIQDLEVGNKIKFDKSQGYGINPYESGMIPLTNRSGS